MDWVRQLGVLLVLTMSAQGAMSEAPEPVAADAGALAQLCEAGEAGPCLELGAALYAGGDAETAHTLFDRACDLGSGPACLRLGLELEFPDFGAPDSDGAMAAYARACDLGEASACDRVPAFASEALPDLAPAAPARSDDAAEAEDGDEAASDEAFAFSDPSEDELLAQERQAMAEACGVGQIDACEIYAAWLRDGTGGTQNMDVARRIFSVICTQGSVKGCYELAWMMYDAGTDGQEMSRARFLFSETCEGGIVEACLQAADMRKNGEGGIIDLHGTARMLALACEGGVETVCQEAQEPVMPDLQAASDSLPPEDIMAGPVGEDTP